MTATCSPNRCLLCGGFFTLEDHQDGRCTDPGHWLAAGLLAQNDFYHMAQLVALRRNYPVGPVTLVQESLGDFWPVGLHHFLTKFYK